MSEGSHPLYSGHVAATAERLRQAREEHGVNAATVARLCGWSPQRVASLETGRTEAKAIDIQLYARITGADPVWLVMGEEGGPGREPIDVPDEDRSYAKPRGINALRANGERRRAAEPRAEPRHPGPVGEPWRPAGIGRDRRPPQRKEDQSA
jgi:transcriptional regulator with XRE-family HTH domain